MVKNKKMSKTSIAVIVLALLLVLSLVMGMTGAWFTDKKDSENTASVAFGTVAVNVAPGTDGAVATYRHGASAKVTPAMPGDDLKVNLAITKAGESQDFYYRVILNITAVQDKDGHDIELANTAVAAAQTALAANNAKIYSTADPTGTEAGVEAYANPLTITLNGDAFGNLFQGATITVSYEVRAVQVANVTPAQAATLLDTGWHDGAAVLA